MADEIPPAPSESNDYDLTKSETIRITLPPKNEQPAMKRETVRINVPGKLPPPASGLSPKKETSKLTGSVPPAPTPPPPSGSKPFVPSAPGAPSGTPVPASFTGGAATPPPKPPSLGSRPTVPLKPGSPFSGPTPTPSTAPTLAGQKDQPKKETARITLPSDIGKAALPKATVRMQQTQPLVSRPGATLTSSSAAVTQSTVSTSGAAQDPAVKGLAIATLVLSLAALVVVYLIYKISLPIPFEKFAG